MFKQLTIFRTQFQSRPVQAIEDALQSQAFTPCAATQPMSCGWVPPRGNANGHLVEKVSGHHIMRLMTERKVLPADAVKRHVDQIAANIERLAGRKPGRKQRKEIKEQAVLELLPMALTKRSALNVWLQQDGQLLGIEASPSRSDEVVTLLVKSLQGLVVQGLHTKTSPTAMMADWLLSGEPAPRFSKFSIDRECELKSTDEMKSVVRYGRHPLDIDEVRQHITQGKVPTKLAMTWAGRISFVLADTMALRKLEFLDGVLDDNEKDEDSFDADAAIVTAELSRMLPNLIEALGGEFLSKEGGVA